MAATTSQKARVLDLVTTALELVRDGKRDAGKFADVLQVVKDDPEFAARLLSPNSAPSFSRDMRKDGWELVEDVLEEAVPASRLELVSFLRRGESRVSGETWADVAEKQGASLGQRQAEYLLEHQGEIPSKWRDYYLVFPGTVWRGRDGRLYVPCLGWHGRQWCCLYFHWLENDWYSSDRLVRLRE